MLFHLCHTQDRRQRVTEVHCTDFATLGSSYLGFVPCAVVPHTAAYREVLLVKIDVLPSQAADLAEKERYAPPEKQSVRDQLRRLTA